MRMKQSTVPPEIPYALYHLESSNAFEGVATVSVLGDLATLAQTDNGPLVRMHSACVYGEVLGSTDCECGPQLDTARQRIIDAGAGILFYLHQEGRGAGLVVKARGYELKDARGLNTAAAYAEMGVPFDQRQYGHCARFLLRRGINK